MLESYCREGVMEVGLDEVGRGSLAGPVVAAGVIWPADLGDEGIVKDSKKLSAKARAKAAAYIIENAIEYAIIFKDNRVIDEKNILQTTFTAMHEALDALGTPFDHLLVDGDKFRPYLGADDWIPHTCVIGGDNKYLSIAAASILAKEAHDTYMRDLSQDPKYASYGWNTNMGYGTAQHIQAIQTYGLSDLHRVTFCRTCTHRTEGQEHHIG